MDDFEKKLFAQLDDDFPGVRVQALDSWRDHLKKARELAQVTGSARQRRRIRELSARITKAA